MVGGLWRKPNNGWRHIHQTEIRVAGAFGSSSTLASNGLILDEGNPSDEGKSGKVM